MRLACDGSTAFVYSEGSSGIFDMINLAAPGGPRRLARPLTGPGRAAHLGKLFQVYMAGRVPFGRPCGYLAA